MKNNKQRVFNTFACWGVQDGRLWVKQPTKEGQCTVLHPRHGQQVSWQTAMVFWHSLGCFNAVYKRQTWCNTIKEPLTKINDNKSPNVFQK